MDVKKQPLQKHPEAQSPSLCVCVCVSVCVPLLDRFVSQDKLVPSPGYISYPAQWDLLEKELVSVSHTHIQSVCVCHLCTCVIHSVCTSLVYVCDSVCVCVTCVCV